MIYFCELCQYQTIDRDRIHYHHIVPKANGGSNHFNNRIFVCPTCHSKIYISNVKGIHGIKGENPIILYNKLFSTGGIVLKYTINETDDIENNAKYLFLKNNYEKGLK